MLSFLGAIETWLLCLVRCCGGCGSGGDCDSERVVDGYSVGAAALNTRRLNVAVGSADCYGGRQTRLASESHNVIFGEQMGISVAAAALSYHGDYSLNGNEHRFTDETRRSVRIHNRYLWL